MLLSKGVGEKIIDVDLPKSSLSTSVLDDAEPDSEVSKSRPPEEPPPPVDINSTWIELDNNTVLTIMNMSLKPGRENLVA